MRREASLQLVQTASAEAQEEVSVFIAQIRFGSKDSQGMWQVLQGF